MLWMRNQLLNYQNAGVLDVEEEFRQRCFHITVYKNYAAGEQSPRPSKVPTAPSTTVDDSISANPAAEIAPEPITTPSRILSANTFLICTRRATISCERSS